MTEHGEASTSALRTRVRLPPSPHIHPHDRVHADIFLNRDIMKRNGIVNLVRLWLKKSFGTQLSANEIIPRNYFHALQMNSFRIDLAEECEIDHICDTSIGFIVLPIDDQYEFIDNQTMLHIIKDWLPSGIVDYKSIKVGSCVRGSYISDSGEIFNERSITLIVHDSSIEELIHCAEELKIHIGCNLILIKIHNSPKMFGV
jgi:hypothetical protein